MLLHPLCSLGLYSEIHPAQCQTRPFHKDRLYLGTSTKCHSTIQFESIILQSKSYLSYCLSTYAADDMVIPCLLDLRDALLDHKHSSTVAFVSEQTNTLHVVSKTARHRPTWRQLRRTLGDQHEMPVLFNRTTEFRRRTLYRTHMDLIPQKQHGGMSSPLQSANTPALWSSPLSRLHVLLELRSPTQFF